MEISFTSRMRGIPFGVWMEIFSLGFPVSSIQAAAFAAAAAQEPVVYPNRRRLPSFSMYCSIWPYLAGNLVKEGVADSGGDAAPALPPPRHNIGDWGGHDLLLAFHHVDKPHRYADNQDRIHFLGLNQFIKLH